MLIPPGLDHRGSVLIIPDLLINLPERRDLFHQDVHPGLIVEHTDHQDHHQAVAILHQPDLVEPVTAVVQVQASGLLQVVDPLVPILVPEVVDPVEEIPEVVEETDKFLNWNFRS